MKTTLLFSAFVLIGAVSFAQTTVKNKQESKSLTTAQANKSGAQLNSSTSTSSSTSIQSDAVNQTEKKAVEEKAKTEEKQAIKNASKDRSLSAEGQSDAALSAGNKGNKINENSSLNSQAKLSVSGVETTDKQLGEKGKTSAESANTVAAQSSSAVKAKASKTGNKMEKTVKTTVKPKPASVKMNAQVKTNTAIRIK